MYVEFMRNLQFLFLLNILLLRLRSVKQERGTHCFEQFLRTVEDE